MRRVLRLPGRLGCALLVAALIALGGTPAQAYLKLGLRDSVRAVSLRWTTQPAGRLLKVLPTKRSSVSAWLRLKTSGATSPTGMTQSGRL